MDVGRPVARVPGVAVGADNLAGAHGAPGVEARCDGLEVGVVVLGSVGAPQPDVDAAEATLGACEPVHDGVVGGDDGDSARGQDVRALVSPLRARRAPVIGEAVVARDREDPQEGGL